MKSIQRRSARVSVQTTKAEQFKPTRNQSVNENKPNLPHIRSSTTISQHRLSFNPQMRHSTMSSINHIARLRTNSNYSFSKSESTRSCKEALNSNAPLLLSAMLIKQMRQDIKINRGNYFYTFHPVR
jgi:hypothetical protein